MKNPPIALAEPVPVGESYLLVRRLAMGGVADIFLARQSGSAGFEKEIVIKRLRPELRSNARVVKMFLEEARIGALLNHPNIVHVYDVDAADGAPYIAMEYIVGGELGALCRRGLAQKSFLPFPHAVELMRQAAAGLGYLHAKRGADGQPLGIVHRDVSPNNLLVTEDGFLKLIDFGIAKSRRTDELGERVLPGKLSYMAPEQVTRRPVDPRADIFSLGVVLYEVTLGRRLFKGPAHDVARRIANVEIEPPTFVRRSYPAALEKIVMKALAREPADRYQNAYDLADDLEELLHTAKLASGPVRIARYLDELGHAEGRSRRPELSSSGRAGSEADAEQSELFSSFRAAPGREWDDAEEPIADVASALGIDVAELRAMRVPSSHLDVSDDARQIRARRATGDVSRPVEAQRAKAAATETETEIETETETPVAGDAPIEPPAKAAAAAPVRARTTTKLPSLPGRPAQVNGSHALAIGLSAKGMTSASDDATTTQVAAATEVDGSMITEAQPAAPSEATPDKRSKAEANRDAKREAKTDKSRKLEAVILDETNEGRSEATNAARPVAERNQKLHANSGARPEANSDANSGARPDANSGARPESTEKVEKVAGKRAAIAGRPDLAAPLAGDGRAEFGAALLHRAPPPHQRWVVLGLVVAAALILVYLIAS